MHDKGTQRELLKETVDSGPALWMAINIEHLNIKQLEISNSQTAPQERATSIQRQFRITNLRPKF